MNSNLEHFLSAPEDINVQINQFIEREFDTDGKELLNLQKDIFKEMRQELGII